MKVHVIFDDAGEVGAIFHPKRQKGRVGSKTKVVLRPKKGQHSAILDVPAELEHLKPRVLHESVRVVTSGGSHRVRKI